MTLTVRVFKNVLALLSERMAVPVVNLLLVVFIARFLGADGLGRYAFIVGFVAFFDIFLDLGINTLIVREVARDRSAAGPVSSRAFTLKLAVTPAVFGAIAVFLYLYPQQAGAARAFYVFAAASALFAFSETFHSLYKAYERMNLVAALVFLRQTALVLFVVAAMRMGYGIPGIAAAYLAVGIAYLAINYIVFNLRVARVKMGIDREFYRDVFDSSLPFITLGFFFLLFYRIDVVMTSMIASDLEAGYFSAASKVVSSVALLSEALLMAVFPILSRYGRDGAGGREKLVPVMKKAFHLLSLISFPMAAGLAVTAKPLLVALFGPEFAPAAPAFVALSLTIPFAYLASTLHFVCMARDMQKRAFAVVLVFLALLVPANYLLIGMYGAMGASLATLGVTAAIFAGLGMMVFGGAGGYGALAEVARPLAASAAMAGILRYMGAYGLGATIVAGALIYVLAVFAIGGVSAEDRKYLDELRAHFAGRGGV